MKNLFLLAIILFATEALGQTMPGTAPVSKPQQGVAVNAPDTPLSVYYVKKTSPHKPGPAYYVNGKLVNETFFLSIDPNVIDKVDVVKGSLQSNGQVYLTTKPSHVIKPISLTQLKHKYTNLQQSPSLFMLDGELVTTDYDQYLVDENRLWRIIVDQVENQKDGINLKVIKLLTKSEENLKKEDNKIRIRGTAVALNE